MYGDSKNIHKNTTVSREGLERKSKISIQPVGNRDRCGKCGARHGGNDHLCPVHGAVSGNCCKPSCNPDDYVSVGAKDRLHPSISFRVVLRTEVNLGDYEMEPPYKHQDDGHGNYKLGCIPRYFKLK